MSSTQQLRGSSIELRELSKHYGSFRAVEDVSLDIEPGEFITFLGPSGSGKTTTLNMIAGFVDVSRGDIRLDGAPIARLAPHRRNIGMVFQSYSLFPHMSVFDNVAYPLRRRGVARDGLKKLVIEALDLVQLADRRDRYPRELSGGQQQRVALARAIVFSPRVLLMDEPLGALDKKLREHLQIEIKRLHKELGMTFVFVTHDQEEALVLSDRIAVFNHGRIAQVGTADELYERPTSLFVADFIGQSNIFLGKSAQDGAACALNFDGHVIPTDNAGGVRAGDAAGLVVRPERISIMAEDAAVPAGHAGLAAQVVQVIYVGAYRKVLAKLASGKEILALQGAGTGPNVVEGERVRLSWPVSCGTLLPGSAT